MEKELQRIIANIYEKTSIVVKALSDDGVIMVGFESDKIPTIVEFKDDIFVDTTQNYTMFKFTFNKISFIGFLEGVAKQQEIYASLISGYIENASNKGDNFDYDSQIVSAVTGFINKNRIIPLMEKYAINKSPCFVILFEIEKSKLQTCKDFLNDYSTNDDDIAVITNDELCAYVKFSNKTSEFDFISVKEYTAFTIKALYEELGIKANAYIGGEVKNFEYIHTSYEQALDAIRFTKSLKIEREVNSYKDYVLVKIIEELPTVRAKEYFDALLGGSASSILQDEQLLLTASTFLNNDLNMSETSRQLYIHRNTLMYRIDRILKMTGLDIRSFNDALVIRLIMLLNKVNV